MKLYTDSTTVLSWVNADATRFKPFVRNKIKEVQTLVSSKCWKYVPSRKNKAADLISKGCKLGEMEIIIKGPDHLYLPESKWPKWPIEENKLEIVTEYKCLSVVDYAEQDSPLFDPMKYSSWGKLLRITAYVFRFTDNIRNKRKGTKHLAIQIPMLKCTEG